jgi:hypothetical protein
LWPQAWWSSCKASAALHGSTGSRARSSGNASWRKRSWRLASLKSISDVTHIDLTEIGGCVYTVRRRLWPFRHRRLRRVVRYRLNEYPQGWGIQWSDRKGVVGQAMRDISPRHFDWREVAAAWNRPGNLPWEAYTSLSEAERMGFSYDEYRKVARKYSEGLAVPIVSNGQGRVLGVFAVDLPYTPGYELEPCRLDSPMVIRIATACAGMLRDMLEAD